MIHGIYMYILFKLDDCIQVSQIDPYLSSCIKLKYK